MTEHLRYIATSREGFVRQVVRQFVANGYYFYVLGEVPEGKDPTKVDEKFVFQYPVLMKAGRRHSRKKRGILNVRYLRYESTWIMAATPGGHDRTDEFRDWREHEAGNIRNCRAGEPIRVFGYSISYVPGGYVMNRKKTSSGAQPERDRVRRVRAQISRESMKELKARLLDNAKRRRVDWFRSEFWNLPFEPYAPVRKQLLHLLKQINDTRKKHGMEKVPTEVIRYHQTPFKVFE